MPILYSSAPASHKRTTPQRQGLALQPLQPSSLVVEFGTPCMAYRYADVPCALHLSLAESEARRPHSCISDTSRDSTLNTEQLIPKVGLYLLSAFVNAIPDSPKESQFMRYTVFADVCDRCQAGTSLITQNLGCDPQACMQVSEGQRTHRFRSCESVQLFPCSVVVAGVSAPAFASSPSIPAQLTLTSDIHDR